MNTNHNFDIRIKIGEEEIIVDAKIPGEPPANGRPRGPPRYNRNVYIERVLKAIGWTNDYSRPSSAQKKRLINVWGRSDIYLMVDIGNNNKLGITIKQDDDENGKPRKDIGKMGFKKTR